MAINYKILGQIVPTANTNTTLYTVPASTQAVCSTLSVCSIDANAQYSVAIRQNGDALDPKHYIVSNANVSVSDSVLLTLGMALGATDVVTVYATQSNVAFNLFGSEIA